MDDSIRDSIMNAADRIGAMADEAGDAALYAVTTSKDLLDRLPNGHSRALWLLLNDPGAFRQAEDVRYADDHYRGRMWEGYVCSAGCSVARVGEALTNFEHAIGAHSKSRHVDAEVCDRSRRRLGGEDHSLVQVTVHREGRAGERKTFTNGRLDRLPDYPVIEAAITYDAASGVIEVVADTRETRETMARLFADHLLNTPFPGQRLPIRKYSLDHFKNVQGFPTDVDDNIEHVSVSLLRLMPHDDQSERVTLECMRGTRQTIWHMAETRFGPHNPLRGGYGVTQVRFTIAFRSISGVRGRRKLPVTITMPQGCNLKDRTERERLIGEKYLRRWGLLRDV